MISDGMENFPKEHMHLLPECCALKKIALFEFNRKWQIILERNVKEWGKIVTQYANQSVNSDMKLVRMLTNDQR